MSIARFSSFELVLLKSRNQVDTAVLLLLAWVLVKREHVSEGQRRRRLAQVSAQFRHGHELGPVMGIAHAQDLQAIQLAAEIMRKDCSSERSLSVMHQAITLATDDGEVSQHNHYILRFLADLLTITPATLHSLFHELTGKPLAAPQDLSSDAYWQVHDPYYHQRQEQAAQRENAQAQEAEQKRQQQEQSREERARRKRDDAQHKRDSQQQKHDEKQRRQQEREQERERHRQSEQQRRQQQQRQKQQQHHKQEQRRESAYQPPQDRTSRALEILGLPPGASRHEVRRAYRRMAQLHHPDRFFSESEQLAAQASVRFQRIKKAYDYLMQTY
ncbi:J domain-containing protein [Vreelandella rituensis]|uniref:Molecular chaperone DnaJ n=1 Tax=Vreelandella rituensis TaxID=2282306 RepID=A0A368U8V1_9GAMM|nr:J domain-containing protein [Halomonas rituensis]RCV92926.1 molecular chaperone DnaJ [Halomonas rituensis]